MKKCDKLWRSVMKQMIKPIVKFTKKRLLLILSQIDYPD